MLRTYAIALLFLGAFAAAQSDHDMAGMSPMQMDDHHLMNMHPETFTQEIVHHATSGTSAEPSSTPTPMLMTMRGDWMFMFHANAFLVSQQQSGARGDDKVFSTNWFMPMAQRQLGPGIFTARLMFSLEPGTVTGRRYPLLFEQGETAFGKAIVDGQHPHDLFMELAALYDLPVGERSLLSFYFAPMGDPAIGPTAYPHRASASENPTGTLGHHQQDSTHVADDVITVGFTHRIARIEFSGFHGREPDEQRWDLDSGKVDSWSTRLTLQPGRNWSGEYSYAHITSPEQLFADEDQTRMTASVMYDRPMAHGNWASTLIWGRTRSLGDSAKANSYQFESTLRLAERHHVWTRIESATRSNELLYRDQPLPVGFHEEPIGRVNAATFGYDRDFDVVPHLATAVGTQVTMYHTPEILRAQYGRHPLGVEVFLRVRVDSGRAKGARPE